MTDALTAAAAATTAAAVPATGTATTGAPAATTAAPTAAAAAAAAVARLVAAGIDAQLDVPLAPLTTYRLGGPAAVLARPTSIAQLQEIAATARASALPILVIGKGSNLLVADHGFSGIAVTTAGLAGELGFPDVLDPAATDVWLGAGVALPIAARRLAAAGLRGFEWAVGVPGSVGGAVRMNAGGHGADIASCLIEATVLDLRTSEVSVRPTAALGLRFRASALTDDELVLAARIAVQPGDRAEALALLDEIVAWRRQNQPGGQNCGSVFVNPIPGAVTAGQLVDQLGLRGHQVGTAFVSPKHANFIQGTDGGRADDVRALIATVREQVAAATGIELRSEVRQVGFGIAIGAGAGLDGGGA